MSRLVVALERRVQEAAMPKAKPKTKRPVTLRIQRRVAIEPRKSDLAKYFPGLGAK